MAEELLIDIETVDYRDNLTQQKEPVVSPANAPISQWNLIAVIWQQTFHHTTYRSTATNHLQTTLRQQPKIYSNSSKVLISTGGIIYDINAIKRRTRQEKAVL